jgi:hypothetical protein
VRAVVKGLMEFAELGCVGFGGVVGAGVGEALLG